jgi:hypothetical protein
MIDYFNKEKCCFICQDRTCNKTHRPCKDRCRCNGCIWLDKRNHICILSKKCPLKITENDIVVRYGLIDIKQQEKLSDPTITNITIIRERLNGR